MARHWRRAISSMFIGLLGIFLAFRLYKKDHKKAAPTSMWYTMIENKFYMDEVYLFITKNIIFKRISAPVAWFDRNVVDASMNGVAWIINKVSDSIKGLQSGQLQHYLFAFVSGVIALFLVLIYLIG